MDLSRQKTAQCMSLDCNRLFIVHKTDVDKNRQQVKNDVLYEQHSASEIFKVMPFTHKASGMFAHIMQIDAKLKVI